MAKKTSVQFYYDYIEQLQDLDDKQFRKVLEAMVMYDERNEVLELDSISKMAFNFIKKRIDYDKDTYNKKCEKNKQNIQNYWNERKQTNTNENKRIQMNTKNTDIDIDLELDIDKDLDIDNNISSSSSDIYDFIQENFNRTLNPIECEEVSNWEDSELTRYAIKQTVLNGVYNIKYITRILESYKTKNITTVQQAQEEEKKRKQKKEEQEKYKGLSFQERQYLKSEEVLNKYR